MNKLIAIMIATMFGVLGASLASAENPTVAPPTTTLIPGTPELCDEADTRPPNVDCDVVFPGEPNPYPPVIIVPSTTTSTTTTVPESTTTTTTPPVVIPPTTVPPALPATGSSGTSGLLQIAALVLTGGLLVLIAARRRTAVTPSTA